MPRPSRLHLLPWLLIVPLLLTGCGQEQDDGTGSGSPAGPESRPGRFGDLDEIEARGTLRILVPANLADGRYLPRSGSPIDLQREAAVAFADSLGLGWEVVAADGFQQLVPMLRAGKGDIVAANLTVTDERRERVDFSAPLTYVREMVVTRADDTALNAIEDLAGRSVHLDPGTAYWESMQGVKKAVPSLTLVATDNLGPDALVDAVADNRIDLTVLDDNTLDRYLGFRDDIRAGPRVSRSRAIAWALRKDSPQLKEALNHFIQSQLLETPADDIFVGDLDAIKDRRVLRVLMRNNVASYFLWRGRLMGFEYELAKRYAASLGVRLRVVVPPGHGEMLGWLKSGRGDIAAGFLVPPRKQHDSGVVYTRRYHSAPLYLVARKDDAGITGPRDLANRTVTVRASSSHWEALQDLKARGGDFTVAAAPEDTETETLIDMVAKGEIDLTVADGHILDLELTWRDDVKAAFALGEPVDHSWALRRGNPELLDSVNNFLKKTYKSTFYNITYDKYFTNPKDIEDHLAQRLVDTDPQQLSPYDDLVRKYAARYGFDWRFIVAQMYQESRFNPKAKSWAGARGLLQILPHTAEELGFKNLENPESGIHAGVKYLDWLRKRFNTRLAMTDRQWFALAAYNAGLGHVYDARRLARKLDLDPNRWFDNVEKAMLGLSKTEHADKSRHGYVRGGETVRYVRDVRERYQAYVRLTGPGPSSMPKTRKPSLIERFMGR